MKKHCYLLIFFILLFNGCTNKVEYYDCNVLLNSNSSNIENSAPNNNSYKLYMVRFISKGGVYAGDRMYYYLTDSLKFSKFIGDADDKESILVNVCNNKAYVNKYSRRNRGGKEPIKINSEVYDIEELSRDKNFDKP
jgi:hypothetical protein